MALLSRADILKADDLKTETVEVPEWGGSCIVSTMSGAGRDAYEESLFDVAADGSMTRNISNVRAKLLSASIVDESGKLLFSAADIVALGAKSVKPIDRLYDVANRMNAASDDDVEVLAKNS